MEPATVENQSGQSTQKAKPSRSEFRVPKYDLGDSVAAAKAIHERGGGLASRPELAAYLDYKTTNSGAFNSRLASARLFGLIEPEGSSFKITPLAQKILMPVYPQQTQEGLIEAFFNVPLFDALYKEHEGKQLPPDFGFKNLLRNKYGLTGEKVDQALRALMESADLAGFFNTRGKTHLIVPTIRPPQGDPVDKGEQQDVDQVRQNFGGGGGDGQPPHDPPSSANAVRLEYVRKLISLIGDDSVDNQQDLMERIEKLLSVTERGGATE